MSNGRSAMLLQPNAEVDWWCAPEMDSTPLLWSLLDAGGAAARWCNVRAARWSGAPAGAVADTVLRCATSRIECRDGILDDGDAVSLVRLVRARGKDLDLTHELTIGGFNAEWGVWDGSLCRLEDGLHVEVGGGRSTSHGRTIRTRLTAGHDEWTVLVVTVNGSLQPDVELLAGRLGGLALQADAELDRARLPRHHPERAADSLAVLKACSYLPTGAVVAALTTSLPEAPGSDRQFDYRYSWLRDASLAVSVSALLGQRAAARRYLSFLRSLAPVGRLPEAPLADIRGGPVPVESEVPNVAGWAGSRPIRVGNDARDQVQEDALGFLVEGISVFLQTGGSLDEATWKLVCAAADRAAATAPTPTNGIWEFRDTRDLVSADIGRWLCLDRAIWIARGWRPLTRRGHWKQARKRARDRVLGALTDEGGLPQSYDGEPRADASALMAVIFGMISRRDPRASRLVSSTMAQLEVGPYLYRYEPDEGDGFRGREGAFVPTSWWAVAALAAVGRVDEARGRADELCATLPRLLAEEVDPASGESLGNVPLVWSHAEAARALYVLDAAALRQSYGSVALSVWRVVRYLRLRWQRPDESEVASAQRRAARRITSATREAAIVTAQ